MLIGIDTNILVRYVADDDPSQFRRAETLIDSITYENPGFISLVALAERVWVTRSRYRLTKPQLVALLNMLLRTQKW